jgi:hypothetical protein
MAENVEGYVYVSHRVKGSFLWFKARSNICNTTSYTMKGSISVPQLDKVLFITLL